MFPNEKKWMFWILNKNQKQQQMSRWRPHFIFYFFFKIQNIHILPFENIQNLTLIKGISINIKVDVVGKRLAADRISTDHTSTWKYSQKISKKISKNLKKIRRNLKKIWKNFKKFQKNFKKFQKISNFLEKSLKRSERFGIWSRYTHATGCLPWVFCLLWPAFQLKFPAVFVTSTQHVDNVRNWRGK